MPHLTLLPQQLLRPHHDSMLLPQLSRPADIPITNSFYASLLDPKTPFTIAILYAVIVHTLNHRSTGAPYRIAKYRAFRWFVLAHNIFLAVYSAWTFVGVVGGIRRSIDYSRGLDSVAESFCRIRSETRGTWNSTVSDASSGDLDAVGSSSTGMWEEALAYYGFWFYLSKFYEVVDTAIILLKGRKSSLLQTYHHSGAMICMWFGIRYMAPPVWVFCSFNSLIHSLMYTYYSLSAVGVRVPTVVKRSLTSLQITQFFVGGASASLYLFLSLEKGVPCLSNTGEAWAVVANMVYLAPLTWLFVAFFMKSYMNKPVAKKQ